MSAVVLIVDDDPVQRRLLESQVRKLGYEARTAEDGAGALDALAAPGAAYDVVLLDDWPGNVRELENAVFRAVVLSNGPVLTAADFPQLAALYGEPADPVVAATVEALNGARTQTYEGAAVPLVAADGALRPLDAIEADAIRTLDGQMSEVARRLGIGRSTLYRRLKDLGLEQECGEGDTARDEAAA